MKLSLFLILFSFALKAKTPSDLTKQYKEKSLAIINQLKSIPASEVKSRSEDLLKVATDLTQRFAKKNPQCASYLKTVETKIELMKSISLSQIEEDFHEGKALPKAPEECYEAKELIVHPATVYLISQQKFTQAGKSQIRDELEEVLGHLSIYEEIEKEKL